VFAVQNRRSARIVCRAGVPPHNKTLQTDEIGTSRGRESAAGALCALRVEDAGGSRDLATISDTLVETL
jgi:hypothetical protein